MRILAANFGGRSLRLRGPGSLTVLPGEVIRRDELFWRESFYGGISGKIDHSVCESVASQIHQKFGCKRVAIMLRESLSASENGWSAQLWDNGAAHYSEAYHVVTS